MALALVGIGVPTATPAVAAAGCTTTTPTIGQTVTCNVSGTETIVVPAGVGSVVVVALGAGGGGGGRSSAVTPPQPGGAGGAGAKVEATVPLVGASYLSIVVGAGGAGGGDITSGGRGGGISSIVNGSTTLLVAGGGGGGGKEGNGSAGGNGGNGGQQGAAGSNGSNTTGGGGGNADGSGSGGAAGTGSGTSTQTAGTSGLNGQGGAGGGFNNNQGGWGGAGYGGGGGGGFASGAASQGGGGGGGSYVLAGSSSVTFTTGGGGTGGVGAQYGIASATSGTAGSVSLTFVADPSPGTPTVPGAPSAVTGVPSSGQVVVSWAVPEFNGLSPITGYKVEKNDGTSWSTVVADTASSALSYTATGLTNGTAYRFRVSAINAIGTGTPSATSGSYTPGTVPGAPTSVTGQPSTTQVVVSWLAPASDGQSPITGYKVERFYASSWTTVVANTASTALSYTATGLTEGGAYKFRVTAINQVGSSPVSAESIAYTTGALPGVAATVTAVAGDAQATVSWSTPSPFTLSPITGYKVEQNDGTAWSVASANTGSTTRTYTATGLTNGLSYQFRVSAINQVGTGSASSASSAVTPTGAPSAPTAVSATPGDAQATLTWTAASNGGSAITGYKVEQNDGTSWMTATTNTGSASTTYTATGLTNGTAYTFRVSAINALGTSAASSASTAVIPAAVPGAPTGVTATAGDAQATVSWTAPVSDGGSAITGYKVEQNDGTSWSVATANTGSTATTSIVTGLANGTAFAFRVSAINAAGTGAASTVSSAVTPVAPPAPSPSPAPPAPAPTPTPVPTPTPSETPTLAPTPASSPTVVPAVAPTQVTRPIVGSVSRVTGEVVAVTVPVRADGAVTPTLGGAPQATATVGDVVRVGVSGVPASTRLAVSIRINGQWRALGVSNSGTRGRATLPAFTSSKPGTFPLRITSRGNPTSFVVASIR